MDHNKEYHDPDYPEPASCIKEEPQSFSEEEKLEKIKSIFRREFTNELEARESEVLLIDQRMSTSRRLLHRLRYAIVSKYYTDQKLHLSNGQIQDEVAAQRDPRARNEVATLLSGQHQLHPSVRKLLGKQSVDIDEIFRMRGPRNKTRKDYVAMLQKRNYTISADSTKSLRPGREPSPEPCSSAPKKVPRHYEPKVNNVVTLVQTTRNKIKHKYRIIIGNTSKYVPAASRLDRSTHKWLLYIRGPASEPRETPTTAPDSAAEATSTVDRSDLSRVVTAVTVTLHHSYAPHHIVHLDKPPYHISRRGWGEFPAKVELHFPLPARNPPASVSHDIKLDRNYTGMQVLGSETVVDVWLYSTSEMLPYEFKDDDTNTQTNIPTDEQTETHADLLTEIKTEKDTEQTEDNWMDFFTKVPTELDVDEMIIKPTKKEIIENNIEEYDKEITEERIKEIKTEPISHEEESIQESTLKLPNDILNQTKTIKKRIVKCLNPTTGKVFYLQMDGKFDVNTVQEIIIDDTATKICPIKFNGLKNARKKKTGGMSLLKPEVKSFLRIENSKMEKAKPNLTHIENDHCYLATPKLLPTRLVTIDNTISEEIKKEVNLYDSICSNMHRLVDVRSAVLHLVKCIPLISQEVRDPDFLNHFPFVVEDSDKFWKLDFAKRRNIEWSRAKLINRILLEHYREPSEVWRTKQILMFVRMHGHHPLRNEAITAQSETSEWSSWNDVEPLRRPEGDIKEAYPQASDINTLSIFDMHLDSSLNETLEVSDDEDIDIVSDDVTPRLRPLPPAAGPLEPLPVEKDEDRHRFYFVEAMCRDIGIQLKNEDVGSGYSYCAVHAVVCSALSCFGEELIRTALAEKRRREEPGDRISVWSGSTSTRSTICLGDVFAAAKRSRLRFLTARDIATTNKQTYAL